MKVSRLPLLFLLILGLLCGCSSTVQTPPTAAPETVPVTAPPTEPAATEAPTEPLHSGLYVPGLSVEDVIEYFNEVCLDAEYIHSGDPSRLQKWDCPIIYALYGEPTPEDRATLATFVQWLNSVEGFPGIREAEEADSPNLRIHFCSAEEMTALMGDSFTGMDGAVTFWYTDNAVYDAIICIRSDLDQHLRSSVILEELYNGLGPIQDSVLRPDSIICADYGEPQQLTATDELILRLLYHPRMLCGMDRADCEALIRELYY